MKAFLFFLSIAISSAQQVKLNNSLFLSGETYNFYNRIDAALLDNDELVVFDKGNLKLKIIDLKKSTLIREFAKGGSGPFELNTRMNLYSNGKHIYLINFSGAIVFNADGSKLNQIKTPLNGRAFFVNKKSNTFKMISFKNNSLDLIHLNENFEKVRKSENIYGDEYIGMAQRNYKQQFTQPVSFLPTQLGVVGFYKGKFKAFIIADGDGSKTTFKENVKREKYAKNYRYGFPPSSSNAKQEKMIKKMIAHFNFESNGYQDDILEIAGTLNNYLIFRINSQIKNHSSFICIDLNKKKESIQFNIPYINDENFAIIRARIDGNTLIMLTKDDENGASIQLQDIKTM